MMPPPPSPVIDQALVERMWDQLVEQVDAIRAEVQNRLFPDE